MSSFFSRTVSASKSLIEGQGRQPQMLLKPDYQQASRRIEFSDKLRRYLREVFP